MLLLAAAVLAETPALEAEEKPVQVYILSGQSNMVGMGQVDGRSSSWREIVSEPVLSIYPGPYDPSVDYDRIEPAQSLAVDPFGSNADFPGEGTYVLRGYLTVEKTGIYTFRPGYRSSTQNITFVDGTEVYRNEPGQKTPSQTPIRLEAGKKTPFKTIYLDDRGSSAGYYTRRDIPGTLAQLVREEGKFPYLVDERGHAIARSDVRHKGLIAAEADKWLDDGCGATPNRIGPELGFGHKVGDFHDEPVLLLKASQGNRSLGWDFLPPGSERFEYTDEEGTTWVYAGYGDPKLRWEKGTAPAEGGWYAGKQYDDCVHAIKEVLANFDEEFPYWKGRGYEIAGFGWWQGHKDGGAKGSGQPTAHALRYEQNLVRLIQSLRSALAAPEAPFVVATCGFEGGENWKPGSSAATIFDAQMAVSDATKHPELGGNIASVDTRAFYRPPEASPVNQGFHYNRNAETFMLVGEAMGEAMLQLKQ